MNECIFHIKCIIKQKEDTYTADFYKIKFNEKLFGFLKFYGIQYYCKKINFFI